MFFHYFNVFYRNILLLIEHLQNNFSRAIYGNDIGTISNEKLRRETIYKLGKQMEERSGTINDYSTTDQRVRSRKPQRATK